MTHHNLRGLRPGDTGTVQQIFERLSVTSRFLRFLRHPASHRRRSLSLPPWMLTDDGHDPGLREREAVEPVRSRLPDQVLGRLLVRHVEAAAERCARLDA